jgi:hypothetical protein
MDDFTLLSSLYEGMTQLLSTYQEFYFLNNTAANPSKYTLISSEHSITFSLPSTINNPAASFSLHSLCTTDFFHFLGVWFNLKVSSKFVHTQISQEYQEVLSIVQWKKLSSSQLTYIHNSVLLPCIEYYAQVTYIPKSLYLKLSSTFCTMFKNCLGLMSSAPSILIHSFLFYNLIPLYIYEIKIELFV